MSDASQDVPEAAGFIADQMANAIDKLLNDWPIGQNHAKVTLDMTFEQWDDLLQTLRAPRGADVEQIFDLST